MKPPKEIDVLDAHHGFTALTPQKTYVKRYRNDADGNEKFVGWDLKMVPTNTLWRHGYVLKGNSWGTLVAFDEKSFFQNNNDVTKAEYKVSGYRYPVITWFDNKTCDRIA